MTDQQDLRALVEKWEQRLCHLDGDVVSGAKASAIGQCIRELREAAAQLPAGVPDGWDFRQSGVEAFVRGPDGSGGWFKRTGTLWQRTLFDLVEAMITAAPQPDSKESR